jgi:hypothetical protein
VSVFNSSSVEPEKSHEVPDVPVELAPQAAAVDQHPPPTDNSATTVDTSSVVEEKKETKSAEPADRDTRTQCELFCTKLDSFKVLLAFCNCSSVTSMAYFKMAIATAVINGLK